MTDQEIKHWYKGRKRKILCDITHNPCYMDKACATCDFYFEWKREHEDK